MMTPIDFNTARHNITDTSAEVLSNSTRFNRELWNAFAKPIQYTLPVTMMALIRLKYMI
jgi:hypothetical protein